jgi:hypothetical protein
MTEPIVPVVPVDPTELATLRQVNSELVAKRARDKAKLLELEQGTATLQAKLTETSESLYQSTVGVPLKMMAESMSTIPDLFLEQFSKHFKVASVNNVLTLQTPDGKPALDKNGKAIPFERDVLTKLLTEGDDARAKTFRAITIASRASGAGGATTQRTTASAPAKISTFGLGMSVKN